MDVVFRSCPPQRRTNSVSTFPIAQGGQHHIVIEALRQTDAGLQCYILATRMVHSLASVIRWQVTLEGLSAS